MRSVAVAIFCKTPASGFCKTRLSPPLRLEDCAVLSICFISDLAATIQGLCVGGDAMPYAVYTPAGTENVLRDLLPARFRLLLQCDGDFGTRLFQAIADLLNDGHTGTILVNADSPTLPTSILTAAMEAVRRNDAVVLSPAIDGGYTLIGLSQPHAHMFADIPWSTPDVHRLTMERAAEIGVPMVNVPAWYDVDDTDTLRLLATELAGGRLPHPLASIRGADAPVTRQFLADRLVSRSRSSSDPAATAERTSRSKGHWQTYDF